MKYLSCLFLLLPFCLKSQVRKKAHARSFSTTLPDLLYRLEPRVIKGDIEALKKVAKYLDSPQAVTDHLDWHILKSTERAIATRILKENCLFTDGEFRFDSTITMEKFLAFLRTGVFFDDITGAF